jgi:hypothetical protein
MLGIDAAEISSHRAPWNKGRLIGQKRPPQPPRIAPKATFRDTAAGNRHAPCQNDERGGESRMSGSQGRCVKLTWLIQ